MFNWLQIILGVLKFPSEVSALIRLLEKTPVEKHDAITKKIIEEEKSFDETGRPKWD